ncbi:MAG TPA: acetyl-CoA carboxylase carboxyltransferase subunit beta [Caulobacteraceae bacterium]|nr:acetyl-CoA carboxylase carboxyltransferase subunit beta [Caulobacteraceae bacterium]
MADDEKHKPPRERHGWFSRFAPGVRKLVERRSSKTPDNLWVKDPDSGEMLYRPDLEAAFWVTPAGRHMRVGPDVRFAHVFDGGEHKRLTLPRTADDPLEFTYGKPYRASLQQARKTTGAQDTMAAAIGRIGGVETVVLVQDFAFMGASLGAAAGEGFLAAADEAVKRKAPFVIFTASGGARMQEGALSLMQMARTTLAVNRLQDARLPYIVVLTDPTYGGVTASYAMLGDVHLAEAGAAIGFSGRRVIEQTIREVLPAGFQTSEFQVERGMVDRVVTRSEIPATLASILKILMAGRARLEAA